MKKYFGGIVFLLALFTFLGKADLVSAGMRYGMLVSLPGYPQGDYSSYKGELTHAGILTDLNIANMDLVFPRFYAGQYRDATFRASGELHITQAGQHIFGLDSSLGVAKQMYISRKDGTVVCNRQVTCPAINYPVGIYNFDIYAYFRASIAPAPYIRLHWRNDESTSWKILRETGAPGEPYIREKTYNDESRDIRIPDAGNERMGYILSGVGTGQAAASGTEARLRFTLPADILASQIMKDKVWLFWYRGGIRTADANRLTVKNMVTNETSTIHGDWLKSDSGMESSWLMGKLNSSLVVDNGLGELSFSFLNLSAYNSDGIAMVVPYNDATAAWGNLKIKATGETAHGRVTHPITFKGLNGRKVTTLQPFFILPDGNTVNNPAEAKYRSNFIAYKWGMGVLPGDRPSDGDYFGVSRMLLPSDPGRVDGSGSTARWYPAYGREGGQLDILARSTVYRPNLDFGGYATLQDGVVLDGLPSKIAPSDAETKDIDWLSFQYISSNFPQNQATTTHGNVESGGIGVAGLMTYERDNYPRLLICPAQDISFVLGSDEPVNLQAWYWEDRVDMPTCADIQSDINDDDLFNNPKEVTLVATWTSQDPTKVSVVAGKVTPLGEIPLNKITASYLDAPDDSINATVSPPPTCMYKTCSYETGYKCVEKPKTAPCVPSDDTCSDITTPETCHNRSPWQEVRP